MIAIILSISFANRIKPRFENELLPNLSRYIEYIVSDIGNPPNLETARQLARELPFDIRIEGGDINWRSSDEIGPIDSYEYEPAPRPYTQYLIGGHRRNHYLLVNRAEHRFLFITNDDFRTGSRNRHWILFYFFCWVESWFYSTSV